MVEDYIFGKFDSMTERTEILEKELAEIEMKASKERKRLAMNALSLGEKLSPLTARLGKAGLLKSEYFSICGKHDGKTVGLDCYLDKDELRICFENSISMSYGAKENKVSLIDSDGIPYSVKLNKKAEIPNMDLNTTLSLVKSIEFAIENSDEILKKSSEIMEKALERKASFLERKAKSAQKFIGRMKSVK